MPRPYRNANSRDIVAFWLNPERVEHQLDSCAVTPSFSSGKRLVRSWIRQEVLVRQDVSRRDATFGRAEDQRPLPAADRRAIVDNLPPDVRPLWLGDASALARAVASHSAAAIIVELDADAATPIGEIMEAVSRKREQILILFRFDLTPRTAAQIVALRGTPLDVRLSLRGFDSLAKSACDLRSAATFGLPQLDVAYRLAASASPQLLDVCVGAAVIGARGASVRELARLCRNSERRLEERLLADGMPQPKRLLMWALCLLTIWRVSHLGWTAEQAAAEAGFSSADVLSKRLARLTGMRMSELVDRMSFPSALDWLSAQLMASTDAKHAASRAGFGRPPRISAIVRD
jgi:hypothetical protein